MSRDLATGVVFVLFGFVFLAFYFLNALLRFIPLFLVVEAGSGRNRKRRCCFCISGYHLSSPNLAIPQVFPIHVFTKTCSHYICDYMGQYICLQINIWTKFVQFNVGVLPISILGNSPQNVLA